MIRERSLKYRRLIPVLLPILSGVVITAAVYFGSRYVWGDIGERLALSSDTTRFSEPPLYVGTEPLRSDGKPLRPYAIRLQHDSLYVSYLGLPRIDIYDLSLKRLKSVRLEESEGGLISSIDVYAGNIYVADLQRQEVRVHDREGRLLDAYRWLPGAKHRIVPHGLTVFRDVLYVTDIAQRQVHAISVVDKPKLTEAGELLFSAPDLNNPRFRFLFPAAAAVTPDGRLLVSDLEKGVVRVLGCDGRYAYSLPDTRSEVLRSPQAIALDNLPNPELLNRRSVEFDPSGIETQGRIHVVDREGKRVVMFDAKGAYVASYGSGRLSVPNGIAIYQDQRLIFIADTQEGALVLFRY